MQMEWKGGFSEMIASTRVRLARNVKGMRYGALTQKEKQTIADQVWEALQTAPSVGRDMRCIEVTPGTVAGAALTEQHLISRELYQNGGYVILSQDRHVSIMIGEEDHIRLQVMGTGFCPKECLDTAKKIEKLISERVAFEYNQRLGYLTSCPTNLGTGLRISVMMHLWMLTACGEMENIISAASRGGYAVRGAGGEGTAAEGGFYQLSNQITMGLTEEAIEEKLQKTAMSILEREKKLRIKMLSSGNYDIRDRLMRSVGAVMTAYQMESGESEKRLSDVLLALQQGYIRGVTPEQIYQLMQDVRPASLMEHDARAEMPKERDRLRAEKIRTELGRSIQLAE